MFDLTKGVPSLETCKRLKELGFPQEGTGYYWSKWKPDKSYILAITFDGRNYHRVDGWTSGPPDIKIKAPVIDEIILYLPDKIEYKDEYGDKYIAHLLIERLDNNWRGGYAVFGWDDWGFIKTLEDEELINLFTNIYIWAKQNNYISTEKEE